MNEKAKKFLKAARKPLLVSLVLIVICGIIFPLLLTGLGQLIFTKKSNGSLVVDYNGNYLGSELLGQYCDWTDVASVFLRGRPSAVNYNSSGDPNSTSVGSGSNDYAPSNPDLQARIERTIAEIEAVYAHWGISITAADIPGDLVTESGSGLDPAVTPEAAAFQVPLLVKTTGLTEDALNGIIKKSTKQKFLWIFGEKTVNVMDVNVAIAEQLGLVVKN